MPLLPSTAQRTTTADECCSVKPISANEATMRFAAFASDGAFRFQHDEPLNTPPMLALKGKTLVVKSTDGKECFAYDTAPQAASSGKAVLFVLHEWWGLNDHIKQESDMLAETLGVRVLALDLYDGKVATTRDSAAKYMQSCSPERAKAIISAFVGAVGTQTRIGTIGWCFGGGWSHQATLLLGKQGAACVIYYGMPETDPAKLATQSAPTLGIFAKQEKWISPEVVAKFETAMKTAGKPLEIKTFDADHGFANPSNPKHNKEYTEQARALVVEFFKKHLLQ
ncbi:MAG: dienelactone hydrolase family protein [Candidatus Kapaibacterium sp.]|nr:MAG: dienelactone hydrolase family protein [Candidatus Kapabacteria bacterium]